MTLILLYEWADSKGRSGALLAATLPCRGPDARNKPVTRNEEDGQIKTRRDRRFTVCAVLVLSAAGAAGGWYWRQHEVDRRVAVALTALEQRYGPPIDTDLIQSLSGNSRYDRESRLLHGVAVMRGGDPGQALKVLGRLRPEGRIRIPLLVAAGEAYYRTGQLADAEHIFRQLAVENPRLSIAHRWLAMIYHEMGAMQDSGQEFQEVTRLEPEDFFAYRMMGLLYLKDYAKYKEAAEAYRQALARNPPPKHVQPIRVELGEALVRLSDFDGALEVLNAAEEDAAILGLKAECYLTRGDLAQASRLLERARALDPEARQVLYLSASIAMEEKKPEAALEQLKTLVERDPLDVQASYLLMGAYQRLGEKGAAVAEAERMDKAKASRKKYWDMYMEVMQRPGDAELRDELAAICDQAGKPDLARVWRRAAEGLRRAGGQLVPEP